MNMKPISIAVLALVSVVLLAAWTPNRPAAQAVPGVITVTGEAEVRAVPDEVILTLGVETSDMKLDVAKRQNDQIVRKVLNLAKAYGIPAEHVQTDYINIEPRYDNGYEQRKFLGYFVTKTVVVTLRDLSKFEDFFTEVLGAGVNYVHSIQFRTTDLRTYRDEARALAIQAAREKASALANALGQTIGQPTMIQENASNWWSGYGAWWGQRWGGGMMQNVIQEVGGSSPLLDSSLAPGQISINASVSVSFALVPRSGN